MKYILALVLLAGCGGVLPAEADCQAYIADLQADKQAGMSCESAKAKENVAHPKCKIAFVCKGGARDGG